jgi:hypothetical protein
MTEFLLHRKTYLIQKLIKLHFQLLLHVYQKTQILMEYLTNWTLTVTMTEFQIPSKQGQNFIAYSAVDINKDGLSDALERG